MADDVVERVTDELLADLIRQGERNAGASARGSAFLSIFRELQERRRSPSPDAEAARREAIEACIATVDLACKANFMMRGGLLLDVLVERLRALSPPVEGESARENRGDTCATSELKGQRNERS